MPLPVFALAASPVDGCLRAVSNRPVSGIHSPLQGTSCCTERASNSIGASVRTTTGRLSGICLSPRHILQTSAPLSVRTVRAAKPARPRFLPRNRQSPVRPRIPSSQMMDHAVFLPFHDQHPCRDRAWLRRRVPLRPPRPRPLRPHRPPPRLGHRLLPCQPPRIHPIHPTHRERLSPRRRPPPSSRSNSNWRLLSSLRRFPLRRLTRVPLSRLTWWSWLLQKRVQSRQTVTFR